MQADNSCYLLAAARQRSEDTLARAESTLAEAEADGRALTVTEFVTRAGVSRAWFYSQPALRERMDQLRVPKPPAPHRSAAGDEASRASLHRRLELAHDRIRQLHEENKRLREQLSRTLGEERAQRRLARGGPTSLDGHAS